MGRTGKLYRCTECGREAIGEYYDDASHKPSGWKSKMFSSKLFCSDRCKNEYETRHSSSKSSSDSIFSFDDDDDSSMSKEERLQYKEEQRLKKIQDREDFKKDQDKSKILKQDGKKWLALWYSIGKNGRIIFGSILAGAVTFSVIGFAGDHLEVGIILGVISLFGLVIGSLILIQFIKEFFK